MRKFFLCSYRGNTGDNFIYRGTRELLSDLQIQTVNSERDADILLFPGGCPTMWSGIVGKIAETLYKFPDKKVVIGPATFEDGFTHWLEIFFGYAERIAGLFCREGSSFANLQQANLPSSIVQGLSHDPALYLKDTEWLEKLKTRLSQEYILIALRRDKEMQPGLEEKVIKRIVPLLSAKNSRKALKWARKRERGRKIKSIETSVGKCDSIKNVEIWQLEEGQYLQAICGAKVVYTDRLHVMIVSAMLGKKIFAYPTLYGKLENVYERSLKGWADVTFVKG